MGDDGLAASLQVGAVAFACTQISSSSIPMMSMYLSIYIRSSGWEAKLF
jgi:hypothetical protein